jgi:hypothetical protein
MTKLQGKQLVASGDHLGIVWTIRRGWQTNSPYCWNIDNKKTAWANGQRGTLEDAKASAIRFIEQELRNGRLKGAE